MLFWKKKKKKKDKTEVYQERFKSVIADPNNKYIPRVENAGEIVDDYLIMHNGIKVKMGKDAYYHEFAEVLKLNKGVHEAQEERVFAEVLKHIPPGGKMIELGAYWAFYSMWFNKDVDDPFNLMVEPDATNLEVGKKNFKLNNMHGEFMHAGIGKGKDNFVLDRYLVDKGIDFLDILHSDIQGYEMKMLEGAKASIEAKKVGYFFISTHGNDLHYECKTFLEDNGYVTIASADCDKESYCHDGVLICRLPELDTVGPIDIGSRTENREI